MALTALEAAYRGRKVLITGHTGFKGSWLALWLTALGAEVVGLALDPVGGEPNHWDLLGLQIRDCRLDIRDESAVLGLVAAERPDIVFHLAAQPLVRRSYEAPLETWSTNVMGTANLLEAVRLTSSVQAVVVVTTDKCYENKEWPWPYRERDRLGGHDPYSASKAGAELVAASYRAAFPGSAGAPLLATARGGNVIGGGDWSADRLIPDLVRSLGRGETMVVRSPMATRPWQHVLDCLSGYLVLGRQLLAGDATCAEAWNFGPDSQDTRTVEQVLGECAGVWPRMRWGVAQGPTPHEAGLLQLDSSKARLRLGWQPVWDFEKAVRQTANWYRRWLEDGVLTSQEDLDRYCAEFASS